MLNNHRERQASRTSHQFNSVGSFKLNILKSLRVMTSRPFDCPIPDEPQQPFPILTGYCDIVCGFGRGSAELGIPTANVPVEHLPGEISKLPLGIYFGFAKIKPVNKPPSTTARTDGTDVTFNYGSRLKRENGDLDTLPVVLSIGRNPFYGNEFNTVELHVIHKFQNDFYGAKVKFNILGYIRPELDYTTKEALINDINIDISKAIEALSKEKYSLLKAQIEE